MSKPRRVFALAMTVAVSLLLAASFNLLRARHVRSQSAATEASTVRTLRRFLRSVPSAWTRLAALQEAKARGPESPGQQPDFSTASALLHDLAISNGLRISSFSANPASKTVTCAFSGPVTDALMWLKDAESAVDAGLKVRRLEVDARRAGELGVNLVLDGSLPAGSAESPRPLTGNIVSNWPTSTVEGIAARLVASRDTDQRLASQSTVRGPSIASALMTDVNNRGDEIPGPISADGELIYVGVVAAAGYRYYGVRFVRADTVRVLGVGSAALGFTLIGVTPDKLLLEKEGIRYALSR